MDFFIEFVIQLLVQFVVEVLLDGLFEGAFQGAARVLSKRLGRYVLGVVLGFGFGLFWGDHLTGGASWPKLLWVSLVLAAAALVLAMGRPRESQVLYPGLGDPSAASERNSAGRGFWRDALMPPWRWSAERLVGFSLINVGVAAGIALAFRPAF